MALVACHSPLELSTSTYDIIETILLFLTKISLVDINDNFTQQSPPLSLMATFPISFYPFDIDEKGHCSMTTLCATPPIQYHHWFLDCFLSSSFSSPCDQALLMIMVDPPWCMPPFLNQLALYFRYENRCIDWYSFPVLHNYLSLCQNFSKYDFTNLLETSHSRHNKG